MKRSLWLSIFDNFGYPLFKGRPSSFCFWQPTGRWTPAFFSEKTMDQIQIRKKFWPNRRISVPKNQQNNTTIGILGQSLQNNEKTTTVHLLCHIGLASYGTSSHWVSKIWSGGISSYLPRGSETGCQKKFLDISRECPGEFRMFQSFLGRARNKSASVIRITETNESDIWIYQSLETHPRGFTLVSSANALIFCQ